MHGRERIAARREAERRRVGRTRARDGPEHAREVDHHVADQLDAARDALGREVRDRGLRRAEEQPREAVADDAVDLLGHAHVERAQARFDVRERQPELRGDERSRERRVGVAVHEHRVGAQLEGRALDADQHRRGLLGVRARADLEPDVRLDQAELLAEHARELVVVVLARVGHHEVDMLRQLGVQRRRLDELRAGARDGEQAHRQEGTPRAAVARLDLQGLSFVMTRVQPGAMTELEGSARGVSLRAAACMLAGDARDPVAGARVRRAVDAQLRRAGVDPQDAGDVRTEVVLALLAAPAPDLALPVELVCARAAVIARNKAIDHGRSRARAPYAAGDDLPEPPQPAAHPGSLADGLDEVTAAAHRRRVRADLARALERLDAPQRAAIGAHADGGAARDAGLAAVDLLSRPRPRPGPLARRIARPARRCRRPRRHRARRA